MNREILSFFNLTADPFGKEIPSDKLFTLPQSDNYMRLIRMGVENRGIGMITGKSGTGKSCLIRMLVSELHTGIYKPLYVCHTTSGNIEFYIQLCNVLGLQPSGRRTVMLKNIKEHIITMNKSHRVHPVLIIDEAHLLSTDILQEIRILTNFEIDSYNALTVIFCGQESFRQKLGLSALESLANSITMNITVETLAKEDTFTYIEKRLSLCGITSPVFTKNAIECIHNNSHGILRIINSIASSALSKAFLLKSSQVEREHVDYLTSR